MRDVEALGDGFVFVAVAHHPLGFGLGFLCDVEEKDAREEKNNQQHSEGCCHGLVWSNEVSGRWFARHAQYAWPLAFGYWFCCNA